MKARLSRILTQVIGCAWAVYFLVEGIITPKYSSLMDRIALIVAATFVALLLFPRRQEGQQGRPDFTNPDG
jgi:hypothetical protein